MFSFLSLKIGVITMDVQLINMSTMDKQFSFLDKLKKRKVSEQNRTSNALWAVSLAFTADETGLLVCLLHVEEKGNNKKVQCCKTFPE